VLGRLVADHGELHGEAQRRAELLPSPPPDDPAQQLQAVADRGRRQAGHGGLDLLDVLRGQLGDPTLAEGGEQPAVPPAQLTVPALERQPVRGSIVGILHLDERPVMPGPLHGQLLGGLHRVAVPSVAQPGGTELEGDRWRDPFADAASLLPAHPPARLAVGDHEGDVGPALDPLLQRVLVDTGPPAAVD